MRENAGYARTLRASVFYCKNGQKADLALSVDLGLGLKTSHSEATGNSLCSDVPGYRNVPRCIHLPNL